MWYAACGRKLHIFRNGVGLGFESVILAFNRVLVMSSGFDICIGPVCSIYSPY